MLNVFTAIKKKKKKKTCSCWKGEVDTQMKESALGRSGGKTIPSEGNRKDMFTVE